MRACRLLPTTWLSLIVLSCGGGSSGSGAVNENEFRAQYCEIMSRCCAPEGYAPPGERCQNVIDYLTSDTGATDAMRSACLTAIENKKDLAEFCYLPMDGDIPVCHDVLTSPTLLAQSEAQKEQVEAAAKKSACTSNPECCPAGVLCDSSATYCKRGTGCQPLIALGEPCESVGCVAEGYCDSASLTCMARKAASLACSNSQECIADAYCNAGQVCAQRISYGSLCDKSDACQAPGYCDSQSICTAGDHRLFCGDKLAGGT